MCNKSGSQFTRTSTSTHGVGLATHTQTMPRGQIKCSSSYLCVHLHRPKAQLLEILLVSMYLTAEQTSLVLHTHTQTRLQCIYVPIGIATKAEFGVCTNKLSSYSEWGRPVTDLLCTRMLFCVARFRALRSLRSPSSTTASLARLSFKS